MSKREVTVVINGKETVSEAAQGAESGLTIFGKRIPFVIDATRLLSGALDLLRGAFTAAKQYVMDSIASYDAYAASQTKLASQSKLTGISLSELNRIAEEGRDRFALSTVVANDAATTVGKYASRAGDASKAGELLAKALDLGAASGLDAAATMEALEMGLRGQDEGFDKLLGKNPSSIWKEYADANGLAVGKMTDAQKRLAELTAIVEAGEKVQGAYNDRVESGAGVTDRLNNKMEDAKIQFGQAIQPLRIFIVQGLTNLIEVGARVALAVARVGNAIGVLLVGAVEGARSAVGFLAQGLGKLTGNKQLEEWGKNQSTAFSDFRAQLDKLEKKYLTAGEAATASEGKQVAAITRVADEGKKAAEKAEKEVDRLNRALSDKLGEPMRVTIGMTEGALRTLGDAARDQLPPEKADEFAAHMQTLVNRSQEVAERVTTIGTATDKGKANTRDMAREVSDIARAGLDAARSFGVIDDSAAASLNSAINIGAALARIAQSGFSFAGVAGVIGGVAALVNTMMAGDRDRREMLRQNSRAILGLTEEVSGLNLNVSGSDIEGATRGLQSLLRNGIMPAGRMDNATLWNALQEQGLTIGQLDRIANELGIRIRDKDGNISGLGLNDLLTAMSRVAPGRVGQSFMDQLSFFREGQRLDGAEGTLGGVGGLLDFLRNVGGVSALGGLDASDPTALRQSLRNLITQLNNGTGIGNDQLGRLTGSQFMQVLVQMIGILDDLKQETESGDSADDSVSVDSMGTVTAGGVTVPVESVQAVIKSMDASVSGILTEHTALQTRIADATESSALSLRSIDTKMDTLIEVTAGQMTAVDARLETLRRMAALERGELPVLR